jgi:hypothetical protein
LVYFQRENGQQEALLGRPKVDLLLPRPRLHGTEQTEVHDASPPTSRWISYPIIYLDASVVSLGWNLSTIRINIGHRK